MLEKGVAIKGLPTRLYRLGIFHIHSQFNRSSLLKEERPL